MKNNKIFNYRLYLEGLKQLKLVGILGAVIMGCAAFFIPLGLNIQNRNLSLYTQRIQTYDMMSLNPAILAIFAFTVIFAFSLFSFLNSRNASDFYHAMPDTRMSLYTSYCASILTMDFLLAAESYIVSLVCTGIFKYVNLRTVGFIKPFLAVMVGSIFLLGIIMISMSLTGTLLSNLCVALMIIAFPRLIATVYMYMIAELTPFIDFNFGGSILDDRLNVVTNLVTGIFIRGQYQAWEMYKSILYTFVVGVIYCIIGAVFFVNRKSETATMPAANGRLQCLFRLVPAMVVSIIPVWTILDCIVSNETFDSYDCFDVAVGYVIAVIAYFAYELATTRKIKNILKSAKGLIWLVIFNVLFIIAGKQGCEAYMTEIKNPEKISTAQISLAYSDYYYYSKDYDFFAGTVENSKITSPEFITFLAEVFNNDVEAYKKGQSFYAAPYSNNEVFDSIEVTFGSGLSQKTRVLYLTTEQEKKFMEYAVQMQSFKDTLNKIAQLSASNVVSVNFNSNEIAMEDWDAVLNAFKEELFAMDAEDILKYGFGEHYGRYSDIHINIETADNKRIMLYMKEDDFLKTKEAAYESINRQCTREPLKAFLDDYAKFNKGNDTAYQSIYGYLGITLYGYGGSRNDYTAYFQIYEDSDGVESDFTDNGYELLEEISSGLKNNDSVDMTMPYVEVRYSLEYWNTYQDTDESYIKVYNVGEEVINNLKNYK